MIDAKEKSGTALVVIKTVADVLEKALEKKRAGKEAEIFEKPVPPDRYEKGILAKADLTKRLEEAEYRKNWTSSRNGWKCSTENSTVCGSR